MTRIRLKSTLALAASLTSLTTLTSVASAQSANHYTPATRGSDWFAGESMDFRGHLRPAFGATLDYASKPVNTYANGTKTTLVDSQFNVHLGGALNLLDTLKLSLELPLPLANSGPQVAGDYPFGDLRAGLDVRAHGHYGDKFTLGFGTQFYFPTGSKSNFTGWNDWRWGFRMLIAGDVGPVAYGIQGGLTWFQGDTSSGGWVFNGVGSLGVRVLEKRLLIGPEMLIFTNLDQRTKKSGSNAGTFGSAAQTPIEFLFAAHYSLDMGLRFGAGAGIGANEGYTSPDFRLLARAEWMAPYKAPPPEDADRDGIPDEADACPSVAGVKSDNPKKNGCPLPSDRDNDGIVDVDDACPDVAGVASTDKAKNGCPADEDGDGIVDAEDACPKVPGVKSDDKAKNGCPLPQDQDNDGIVDGEDACPTVPGIKSDDKTKNGCPDPDRDHDGIPNEADACPDDPGPADANDPKRNGCPAAAFQKDGSIKILDQIKFQTGSAAIVNDKVNAATLGAVVAILEKHPEVKFMRIEGHTDNKGNAAGNQKLSQARAQAVADWLVKNGKKDKNMFRAVGYGQEKPIASNDTDAGRANNRRVEFHTMTEEEAKAFDAKKK